MLLLYPWFCRVFRGFRGLLFEARNTNELFALVVYGFVYLIGDGKTMTTLNKTAKNALNNGRRNAAAAGHIARSAAISATKAGVSAAIAAGAIAVRKGIQEARSAPKRRKRAQIAAAVVGVAALTTAGVLVSRHRRNGK